MVKQRKGKSKTAKESKNDEGIVQSHSLLTKTVKEVEKVAKTAVSPTKYLANDEDIHLGSLEDIPLEERVRIIKGEYLKGQVETPTRGELLIQSIFVGGFLAIVYFVFDYIVRDVLLHDKPRLLDIGDPRFLELLQNTMMAFSALVGLVFLSSRFERSFIFQWLLVTIGVISGCNMFWIMYGPGRKTVGKEFRKYCQSIPGLFAIWIATIIQLSLVRAVISVGIVGLYVFQFLYLENPIKF